MHASWTYTIFSKIIFLPPSIINWENPVSFEEFNSNHSAEIESIIGKYSWYIENGARLESVKLIDHNDNILMEDSSNSNDPLRLGGYKVPSYYNRPLEYYSPYINLSSERIYSGYPFHPIPPMFTPIYLAKSEQSIDNDLSMKWDYSNSTY